MAGPERVAGGPFGGAGSPRDAAVVALALQRNPELGRGFPPGPSWRDSSRPGSS